MGKKSSRRAYGQAEREYDGSLYSDYRGYKYIVRGLVCGILMIMNRQSKDSVRYVFDEPSGY